MIRKEATRVKLRSAKICIGDGIRNVFRNGLMSFASIGTITVCLILLGVFYCIVANVWHITNELNSSVGVVVFMKEGITEEETKALIDKVAAREEVKEYKYTSAEEAWQKFREELLEDGTYDSENLAAADENGNPLKDSANIEITLNNAADQTSLVVYLESQPEVRKVNYSADTSKAITTVSNWITVIGLAVILLLVIIALILITNTIKLSIYSRRDEISIMKMLGARDAFVRMPFVVEGLFLGLVGAILPCILVWFGYDRLLEVMGSKLGEMSGLVSFVGVGEIVKVLFPAYLILSVVVGGIGAGMSIRKYLRV